MRASIVLFCVLVASIASAGPGEFRIDGKLVEPNADATVSPGDIFGVEFTLTFTNTAYSGPVTIELSIGAGAGMIGRTLTAPVLTPGCDVGLMNRLCTGSISIPANGTLVVKQGIGFAENASGTIPYRIRVLVYPGGSTILAADSTFTFNVLREPRIVPLSPPGPLLQPTGQGGSSSAFGVANIGSEASQVTLAPQGDFFTVAPASFTLEPGARQVVTVTGQSKPAGAYSGAVGVSGAGVPQGLMIPVQLLSANRPSTRPEPRPGRKRLDTSGGTVQLEIRNEGTGTVRGLFHSDYPWLIPPQGLFTMNGGESRIATFTIDPSRRSFLHQSGTVRTRVRLEYLLESATATGGTLQSTDSPGTASTSVQVSSTNANLATAASIPPLGQGEIALLVPGIGRVVGSVGQFLSDLSLASKEPAAGIDDVRLFYSSGRTSLLSSDNVVDGTFALLFDDILQSVYREDNKVGTLQVRAPLATSLAVAAAIYNVSDEDGNYGTVVPAFRSDRAIGGGSEQLLLTGLRKDASGHTNLYVQEAAGAAATAEVQWLSTSGTVLATSAVNLDGWGLSQIVNQAPDGTVAARIRRTAGTGRLVAYATPVDRMSGDTWAIADWATVYGYPRNQTVIVPVAGSVHGANETFFRTDLALTNTGSTTASGTLHYNDGKGARTQRTITLGANETRLLPDVAGTTFQRAETTGYLKWVPSTGSLAVSSRTYTTVAGSAATFGTGTPTLPLESGIRLGEIRKFAGFDDASIQTVRSGTPGSVRTNFGIAEVGGAEAIVRVRLRYSYPSQLATTVGARERDFTIPANGFLLVSNISNAILQERRDNFGDLTNLTAEFEVVNGSGRVIPFLTINDNGTGDSILRTE